MNMMDSIREEYFAQTRELLAEYPRQLQKVEALWAEKKYREAYLSVARVVNDFGLIRSPRSQKADENFYWVYVN